LECDVLVEAIGSHENTEWLQGNDIDVTAGVLTDDALRAVRASNGAPWNNVFAIGDVARFVNPIFDETPRRVEHWNIPTDSAKRVGKVVATMLGDGIGGVAAAPEVLNEVLNEGFAPIPSFWSDQYDMHILAYGLLGLADEIKLIDGELSGDCVFGYYRGGKMVGVCGIGLRSVVQKYRSVFTVEGAKA
jgi:hypothetical protein